MKILKIPKILHILSIHPKDVSFTIAPFIFLTERKYQEYISNNLSPESKATLVHEKVHLQREKDMGIFLFVLKYILSKEFRFQEELHAITEEMKVYKESGIIFDTHKRVEMLSGPIYWKCVAYDRAKKDLDEMWNKI